MRTGKADRAAGLLRFSTFDCSKDSDNSMSRLEDMTAPTVASSLGVSRKRVSRTGPCIACLVPCDYWNPIDGLH